MNKQDALTNLRKLADTAVKNGYFPTVRDAALYNETLVFVENNLIEPNDSNNHKQQKQANNNQEIGDGFETVRLPEYPHP